MENLIALANRLKTANHPASKIVEALAACSNDPKYVLLLLESCRHAAQADWDAKLLDLGE